MTEKTNRAVTAYEPSVADLPPQDTTSAALILSGDAMDRAIKFADIMASGVSTVPRHLQKNRGDCLAVTLQAMQWGMNPFAVAQKTHTVNGTLGYEAQLVNAVITAKAPVTGRLNYEWFGDWDKIAGRFKEIPAKTAGEMRIVKDWKIEDEEGLGIRVWATFKGESEPRELRLLLSQAGVRNSPLWGQDPKQQLAYLAVKRWSRLYCPDVILGVYTPEDLAESPPPRDMGPADVVQPTASDNLYNSGLAAANKGIAAYQEFWKETGPSNRKLLAGDHEEFKERASEVDRLRTVDVAPADSKRETAAAQAEKASDAVDPAIVYASLQAAFDAKSLDELNVAADMIRSVADEEKRKGLETEFQALRSKLEDES